jgi:hypothetical protein
MDDAGRVYSLVAEPGDKTAKTIEVVAVLADGQPLTPDAIDVASQVDRDVRHSARRGAWISYQELKKRRRLLFRGEVVTKILHRDSVIAQSGVIFDFAGNTISHVSGPSAGLCFLIKLAREIIEEFLQLKGHEVPHWDCAATGILSDITGSKKVAEVEAIEAKIEAALQVLSLENGGIVFYPRANDPLAPAIHHKAEQKGISLVGVDTPQHALTFLLKKYGFEEIQPPDRWPKWLYILLALLIGIIGAVWWKEDLLRFFRPPAQQEIASLPPVGDNTLPAPVPVLPRISVAPALFYEGAQSAPIPLPKWKALRQGDGFRVQLKVNRDCFLYVFSVDSKHVLFPLAFPALDSQPVPADKPHWVPQQVKKRWAELDDTIGEETVLVWATITPSAWLEEQRTSIESNNLLPEAERKAL